MSFDPAGALGDVENLRLFREGSGLPGAGLSAIGDINGDGVADIGVALDIPGSIGANEPVAYVLFGPTPDGDGLDLGSLTAASGFAVVGADAPGSTAASIAAAGDVNGDSLQDFVLGLGEDGLYVVFGRDDDSFGSEVDLTMLDADSGTNVRITIAGGAGSSAANLVAAGAGDLDSDGLDDIVFGLPDADDGTAQSGIAGVLFGSAAFGTIGEVVTDGTTGFLFRSALGDDARLGTAVAGAGDVNQDGIDDVVIGAPTAGAQDDGAAYVVFGRDVDTDGPFAAELTPGALNGTNGFAITGVSGAAGATGRSVAGAGDINGDGVDDLLIGAPDDASHGNPAGSGTAYAVFGQEELVPAVISAAAFGPSLDLGSLGAAEGLVIPGLAAGDAVGTAVAGGVDVSGDGIADLVIGGPGVQGGTGAAYLVFGAGGLSGTVDLAGLDGTNGTRLDGTTAGGAAGTAVGLGPDLDDDGNGEVLVNDGLGTASSARFIVYGPAVPDAVDDGGAAFTTDEDTPFTTGNVLANDDDPAGGGLTVIAIDTTGTQGLVIDEGDGTFAYSPNGQFEGLGDGDTGTDSFTYTVEDSDGLTDTATVTITIEGVTDNQPPEAADDTASGPAGTPLTIAVLDNDSDPDGDTIGVTGTTDPENGGIVVNDDDTITYTPENGFSGTDSFTYTIADFRGGIDTATVTVTIDAVTANTPPVAQSDVAVAPLGTPITISVLANDTDADGDPLTITDVGAPVSGEAVIAGANASTITYTPDPDFIDGFGLDAFSYTISDGKGGTDSANILVFARVPVTIEDDVITVNVTGDGFDLDPDGVTLREAIMAGNAADRPVTIRLPSEEVTIQNLLESALPEPNANAGAGDLDILGDITIRGPGTIRADGLPRLFDVQDGGRLTLENVVLNGGGQVLAPEDQMPGAALFVREGGTAALESGTIVTNFVQDFVTENSSTRTGVPGKEIVQSTFGPTRGAAIFNDGGILTLNGTGVGGNRAAEGTALFNNGGSTVVSNSQFALNLSTAAFFEQKIEITAGVGNFSKIGKVIPGDVEAGTGVAIYNQAGVIAVNNTSFVLNGFSMPMEEDTLLGFLDRVTREPAFIFNEANGELDATNLFFDQNRGAVRDIDDQSAGIMALSQTARSPASHIGLPARAEDDAGPPPAAAAATTVAPLQDGAPGIQLIGDLGALLADFGALAVDQGFVTVEADRIVLDLMGAVIELTGTGLDIDLDAFDGEDLAGIVVNAGMVTGVTIFQADGTTPILVAEGVTVDAATAQSILDGSAFADGTVLTELLFDGPITFTGSDSSDNLTGTDGPDSLDGGGGSDALFGLGGLDTLIGGNGRDVFAFVAVGDSPAGSPDRVGDFAVGSDLFDLALIDADPATADNDNFLFIGTDGFSGTAGELRVADTGTGDDAGALVQGDTDGDGSADLEILLVGVTAAALDPTGFPGIVTGNENEDPTAEDETAVTLEDAAVTVDVLDNDTDPDGDPLSVAVALPPSNGTATVNGDNTITYVPDSGFTGTDQIGYAVEDGRGGFDGAFLFLTVDADESVDPNLFGILVDGLSSAIVSGGTVASIIDAPGAQVLEVRAGASLDLASTAGANSLVLPGDAGDFAISREVAAVTLDGPGGETVTLTARTTAQTLIFDDGALALRVEGDSVLAGSQTVSETAAPLIAPLDDRPPLPDPGPEAPAAPNFFGIVLEDTPAQLIGSGVSARIVDAPGAQTYHVGAAAALDLQGSAGANTLTLQLEAGSVDIVRGAATVTVSGPNGESVSFTARQTPQTLVFLDGAVDIRIDGNSVVAGDQTVTETSAPLTAALDPGQTAVGVFAAAAESLSGPPAPDDMLFG
ncbi:MAG: tandem-95 repeat protein [Alphaproteobacteria bacterium]|jgi:hypothetical protein|nr:tandem-95 repeat protein [Alphaproteobacteria bacterium]